MIREPLPAGDGGALPATVASTADDRELRAFVERSLGETVDELVREPLATPTSFPCEVLTARCGARTLELFFKDFGSCRLPRASDELPQREIEVYRRILDPALGAPRHVGSILEPGRAWLLLEHVRGAPLRKRDVADWNAAAAWIARLQAVVPPEEPALTVHDAAHLHGVADTAVRTVSRLELGFNHRLQKALVEYEVATEELADQPRVLVHGSFRVENLLVVKDGAGLRIAPVDWENAALGSALYDVAFLTANRAREEVAPILEAFRTAAAALGRTVPAGDEAWEQVLVLRLHKLLRSLGRAAAWRYSRESVEHIVNTAVELGNELREARQRRQQARLVAPEPSKTGVQSHPALRAWRTLATEPFPNVPIQRIQGGYFGRMGRVVYRLGAVGPCGLPLVAKRCKPKTAAVERFAYAELLPCLHVSSARHLGWIGSGETGWLFLEDVGARRLDTSVREERALALDWLAGLHLASARIAAHGPSLPDRGPRGYRQLLTEARESTQASLGNPALTDEGRASLAAVIEKCERVERGWDRIESVCVGMPAAYAHGDFRPKNLFVQDTGERLVLRVIDWEYSGWGVPAADLGSLLKDYGEPSELAGYRAAIEPLAPGRSLDELWRWVIAGRVMRAATSMHWVRNSLAQAYLDKPLANLVTYGFALEKAFDDLGQLVTTRKGP